jgi:hypothetical protein
MTMNKPVYNCILFSPNEQKSNGGYTTYHKVNSLENFRRFCDKEHPNWKWFTYYDNKTREKLGVIKNGI